MPLNVAVGVSTALMITVIGWLVAWTAMVTARLARPDTADDTVRS